MSERYNIPNIYVDLIHKIKQIEGVDIEYIDKLVGLLYQDINIIDNALTGVIDMIPEGASSNNKFATASDITTLSGTIGAIQEVIPASASSDNKLVTNNNNTIVTKGLSTISVDGWTLDTSGYYTKDISLSFTVLENCPYYVALTASGQNIVPAAAEIAAYNQLAAIEYFGKTLRLYSNGVPGSSYSIQSCYYHRL